MTDAAPTTRPIHFDALLYPHRSLGPRGFAILMVSVVVVSTVAGVVFMLHGLWPVFGFYGLDVLLIYWAFKASYRSGRLYETVQLTDDSLVVRRVQPSGKAREWRFEPTWLRVDIDEPPQHRSPLVLSSHGRRLEIGAFLSPGERGELAQALRHALSRRRDGLAAD